LYHKNLSAFNTLRRRSKPMRMTSPHHKFGKSSISL